MSAFNVVRFKVKPGRDNEFLDAHRIKRPDWPGFIRARLIKTGEHSYCIMGEWTDMESMATARPKMIAMLDSFRDTLEDQGGGLGATDPVSGPVVVEID